MSLIKTYYVLTKPGIIYGNDLSAIAGFFLASHDHFDGKIFLAMLAGISLVMAAACVFNNVIDRDIDKRMLRTSSRAMVKESIPIPHALTFGTLLGLIGLALLNFFTNPLTAGIALIGLITYVGVYTPSKRRTTYSTLLGSIPGATPPVIGYTAVSNHLNTAALLLFLALVFWQMPHFYAIGMFRVKDYAQAGLPILPIKKGGRLTKVHMIVYTLAFAITVSLFSILGFTGIIFLLISSLLSLAWLWMGIQGLTPGTSDTHWARKMFRFSLVTLTALCVLLSISHVLP